mgnify:CR=1 FL=1
MTQKKIKVELRGYRIAEKIERGGKRNQLLQMLGGGSRRVRDGKIQKRIT